MPTRNAVPTEHPENREAAKLQALRDAAQIGFADLEEGRFTEVSDSELEDFIADLGTMASNL